MTNNDAIRLLKKALLDIDQGLVAARMLTSEKEISWDNVKFPVILDEMPEVHIERMDGIKTIHEHLEEQYKAACEKLRGRSDDVPNPEPKDYVRYNMVVQAGDALNVLNSLAMTTLRKIGLSRVRIFHEEETYASGQVQERIDHVTVHYAYVIDPSKKIAA